MALSMGAMPDVIASFLDSAAIPASSSGMSAQFVDLFESMKTLTTAVSYVGCLVFITIAAASLRESFEGTPAGMVLRKSYPEGPVNPSASTPGTAVVAAVAVPASSYEAARTSTKSIRPPKPLKSPKQRAPR